MRVVLFFILVSSPFLSFANNCRPTKLIHFEAGKSKTKVFDLCFIDSVKIISKNCIDEKCLPDITSIPVSHVYKDFGTPGANLCAFIGGEPTLFEFTQNNSQSEIDLCLLNNSKTQVNTSYIFQKYKGAIK